MWAIDTNLEGNSLCQLPTGCLSAGTFVLLANGKTKKVEELRKGEKLLSYDNYTKENVSNKVSEVIRTSINPKPMIEFVYNDEIIKTTYDHPFFDGEKFYPLYQLAWGEMEASQRSQLELLCEQYGQALDHNKMRGLLSCCNETCPRCERLSKDGGGRENGKNSQANWGKLAEKSKETSCHKSYQRYSGRQPRGEFRMVYGKIQCVDWSQDRKDKSSDASEKPKIGSKKEAGNQGVLSEKNNRSETGSKNEGVRFSAKEIPASCEACSLQNCDKRFVVKEAEPYYSICMREAPHTYYIGKRGNFLTHNSGKSIIVALLAVKLNQDVLILQPSKEILEQNRAKLGLYVDPADIGTYSASMNEKTIKRYTFATIGSIYKKAEMFKHFKMVIVDECHLISIRNLDSMFTSFLRQIGNPRVIGLTATPYRMDTAYKVENGSYGHRVLNAYPTIKLINRMRPKNGSAFWSRLIFNLNVGELMEQGYLCPLEYIDKSLITHEDIPVNKTLSDFDLDAYDRIVSKRDTEILDAIKFGRQTSKSVLVFCSSVLQAERLAGAMGDGAASVSAKTPAKEREAVIRGFTSGAIPVVFNVGVLTTGFDYPGLDCIVLNRPTRSIALYYQMLGRGVRVFPGKTSCKIIDLTSTVKNLGRVETIKVEKVDNKWELLSEAGSWHGRELYKYQVKKF